MKTAVKDLPHGAKTARPCGCVMRKCGPGRSSWEQWGSISGSMMYGFVFTEVCESHQRENCYDERPGVTVGDVTSLHGTQLVEGDIISMIGRLDV